MYQKQEEEVICEKLMAASPMVCFEWPAGERRFRRYFAAFSLVFRDSPSPGARCWVPTSTAAKQQPFDPTTSGAPRPERVDCSKAKQRHRDNAYQKENIHEPE